MMTTRPLAQSVGVFLAGAASALATVALWKALSRRSRTDHLGAVVQGDGQNGAARSLPPELEQELFARVVSFFGEDGFHKIEQAFLIVIGLGGVGSHAAHMLARSGVRRIRVVDFDQVTLSSLNRHAVATLADVGLPKADVLRDRLRQIVPGCHVEAVRALFSADNAAELLSGSPTFVLDCIDDVATKADLLGFCQTHRLRVIASLGAGLKADPTRLHIGQLDNTKNEPLAVRLRYMLRKKGHAVEDITTIYCNERPRGELLPLTEEQKAKPEEFGVVENFRIRVLPVLGTMPAIFGQAMAAYVLCELAGQPIVPTSVEGMGRAGKNRMLQHLKNREKARYGNVHVALTVDDVEEVVQEVWSGKCVATGLRQGHGKIMSLTRWDRSKPPSVSNLVLLASAEVADRFDEEGPAMLDEDRRQRVEQRLKLFS